MSALSELTDDVDDDRAPLLVCPMCALSFAAMHWPVVARGECELCGGFKMAGWIEHGRSADGRKTLLSKDRALAGVAPGVVASGCRRAA